MCPAASECVSDHADTIAESLICLVRGSSRCCRCRKITESTISPHMGQCIASKAWPGVASMSSYRSANIRPLQRVHLIFSSVAMRSGGSRCIGNVLCNKWSQAALFYRIRQHAISPQNRTGPQRTGRGRMGLCGRRCEGARKFVWRCVGAQARGRLFLVWPVEFRSNRLMASVPNGKAGDRWHSVRFPRRVRHPPITQRKPNARGCVVF